MLLGVVKDFMGGVILVALLLGAAGCRHVAPVEGMSSFRVVEPPPTPPSKSSAAAATEPTGWAQYREASVQEKSVVLPVYPPRALLAKAGAAQVGVHVVVDTDGHVAEVRPSVLAISITPPGFADEFREAVEVAVRQWKFRPARVEHVEAVTTKGFTYSRVARTETIEAELDLAFTFTTSGKVEVGK